MCGNFHSRLTDISQEIVQKGFVSQENTRDLEELGLELCSDYGTDRIVFESLGQNFVIKIARSEEKQDINYDEAAVYNQYKDSMLFAEVQDTGPHYSWLQMRKCTMVPDRIGEFEEMLAEKGFVIDDLHADNIGVYISPTKGEVLCAVDFPDTRKL